MSASRNRNHSNCRDIFSRYIFGKFRSAFVLYPNSDGDDGISTGKRANPFRSNWKRRLSDAGLRLPLPISHLGHVLTEFLDIAAMLGALVAHGLVDMGRPLSEPRHPVDHILD